MSERAQALAAIRRALYLHDYAPDALMAQIEALPAAAPPVGVSPQPTESEREVQIAHSLLSETRAKVTEGRPIWERFEWLKTVLVRERDEAKSMLSAAQAECEAFRQQLAAAEHRRCAAENRADAFRMENDALKRPASLSPVEPTPPEREPTGWYCGCGWANGLNLNACGRCTRPASDCAGDLIYRTVDTTT